MQNADLSGGSVDPLHLQMSFDGTGWRLREAGAVFNLHRHNSKAMLMSFVNGLMQGRTGSLVVEKEDGSAAFEQTFTALKQKAAAKATAMSSAISADGNERLVVVNRAANRLTKSMADMLEDVRVIIEERHIGLAVSPENWRRYEFAGLESLPDSLAPAFALGGVEKKTLNLGNLLCRACAAQKEEIVFDEPYVEGDGKEKKTILRTVTFQLKLRAAATAKETVPLTATT